MAKSRLITGRSKKKSTVLVSKRTLQEAITRANMLVEELMESNPNDPSIEQIEGAVEHMSRVLNADPQQMQQDGASSISDYMDDAVMPEEATKLKNEVDMILKMHSKRHGPHPVAEPVDMAQSDAYSGESQEVLRGHSQFSSARKKQADGGAAFTTDRDEKGEAKAPEKLEVPRIAKKKKEAVPEEPMATAPAAVEPAPAAIESAPPLAGGTNPIDYIPTETLIKVIGDLPKEEDFAQNKGKQDAVVQLTEILKSRPVLPPEQPEGAVAPAAPAQSTAPALAEPASVPAPVAASAKKADLGDHAMGNDGTIGNGSGASTQIGQGGGNAAPEQISANPEPEKAKIDLGGLSIASLEDEKTADYRIQDYKLTEEGIRPSGALPTMDEQESGHHSVAFPEETGEEMSLAASVQKEAVTPPGISEELMHKLKKQYPGEPDKAYATAWSIHNKKGSALKVIAAEIEKIASGAAGGGWSFDIGEKGKVVEDGGRTPEVDEAHAAIDESGARLDRPETVPPIRLNKQAAEMTTSKAVKEAESLGNDLKKMYLDAKSLTQVNDTRAVREAVEAIFRAADMFDEATKTLNKQHQQEESEAAAAEIKEKNKGKKSSFDGLALAAAE